MKTAIITALLAFVLVAASANALTVDRILLSSDNHADATVAGAIAEDINAALVITPRTVFTKAILDNITAASPRKVIIIGGASAVPQAYIDALKAANIEVKVVGGKTRQQTSIMAYNEFKSELNKRPLIADGKEEIAVQDAIPVYLYDNKDEQYISEKEFEELALQTKQICRMIAGLIHYLQSTNLQQRRTIKIRNQ